MEQHTQSQIVSDNSFVIIPQWILFSGISDGALRLYAVLQKYANNDTRQAFPARSTLADDIHKSKDSVDRYIKELKRLGALKVTTRKKPNSSENYTNLYTVVTINKEVAAPMPPRGRTDHAENYTHLTKPTSVSPLIPESETTVAPLLPDGKQAHTQASQADPLGPIWYHSEQRQYILQLIRTTAFSKAQQDGNYWDHLYTLSSALEETFNDDEIIGWLIDDRGWEPPRKAVEKFEAAKWLNMLLNTWKEELPGLSFPAEDLAA